jgi:ferrous iron transport protein A
MNQPQPHDVEPPTTLNTLTPGQSGLIIRVGGRAAVRRRLLELGLVRGETIAVERVAPLGDPLEFTIKGYHLSLRRRDAANIEVQPHPAPKGGQP